MVLIEWRRLCFLPEGRTFPSPYGDYGSYLEGKKVKVFYHVTVSVPLRGLWFLSPVDTSDEEDQGEIGFRPLTGIMVLIGLTTATNGPSGQLSFRPLTGIMVLINMNLTNVLIITFSFRPLTGIMVLISIHRRYNGR